MMWTRSNTTRGIVIALLVAFIVIQVAQRDWPWVGVMTALLALNVLSWRAQRSRSGRPDVGGSGAGLVPTGVDSTLSELLDRPAVQQVWSSAPRTWQQVSYLGDEGDLALDADEVADYVWVITHDDESEQAHWSVAVGDELKPLLDLDVDQDADPLIATLLAHAAVVEALHADREVYEVVVRTPMTVDEIATLAARGLIAHHLDAVRRLRPGADDGLLPG